MNIVNRPVPETSPSPCIRRRQVLRVLLALSVGLIACWATAAETKTPLPPLRVGVSPVFPPMVFKQGKELAGVEVDLAREFGKQLGREIVFVELDWKDQTEALTDGRIDIIMSSMSMTPARNSVMSFTQPYLKVGQMALARREDRKKHILGVSVPSGTKIAVIKATTGDFLVQRDYPKAKREVFATGAEAARALMRGRVDLFISDSTLVWNLAGTHAADNLAALPFVLSEEVLAWGVRRGNDDLLAQANAFIASKNQDGSLTKTFRRWMAVE